MASKNTSEYQLLIKLGAQVDKSVDSAIGKLTKKLGGLAILKIAKDAAVSAGKAVLGYAKDSLEAYSTLEKSVVNAANVFGGTAEQVELNEDAIERFSRGLAKRLPYSADQAADSLYYLGLVGIDLQDALDGAEQGLSVADKMMELAYVNGNDVATTVDLITDAMSGLNKEITKENVTDFMDLLTKTMSNTNTNADQMLNAILGVGQTAGMVNMGEDELAAYIGLLANYGTKDTQAGTALNSMFTRMIGNSTAIKAYKSLGVQMYDSSGGFKGVTSILTQTEEALSKLTDKERNPLMKDLFGIHYMNEANILLNAMDEKTDELGNKTSEYADILATVSDNAGSLDQMVENSLDTLDAQYTIFKNQWTDIKYTIGEALKPAAVEAMKSINQEFMADAESSAEEAGNFISKYITPNIGTWVHDGVTFFQNLKSGAAEFAEDPDVKRIINNTAGIKDNMVEAFSNLDLTNLKEATSDLADTALKVVGDITGAIDDLTEKAPEALQAAADITTGAVNLGDATINGVRSVPKWFNLSNMVSAFRRSNGKGGSTFWSKVFDAKDNSILGNVTNGKNPLKEIGLWPNMESFDKILGFSSARKVETEAAEKRAEETQKRLTPSVINIQELATDAGDALSTVYNAGNKAAESLNRIGNLSLPAASTSTTRKGTPTEIKKYKNSGALPFADGGIVTRPTLSLIGEAGEKEAVIPLSKIGDVVSSVSGGNVTFAPVINVSGGNAGEGVRQALKSGYEEFKAYYKRMVKEQRRVAF